MRSTYRGWTTAEERTLITIAPFGLEHACRALGRTPWSVKSKASELGVSLRSDATEMPPDALDRVRQSVDAPVCPGCGKRPVTVPATGLCGSCHYDRIVAVKREALEVEIARKRLDVIRHKRHRLRICEACGVDFYPRKSSSATKCEACR